MYDERQKFGRQDSVYQGTKTCKPIPLNLHSKPADVFCITQVNKPTSHPDSSLHLKKKLKGEKMKNITPNQP